MSGELSALSQAWAQIVQAAGASVVRVDGGSRWGASGFVWSPEAVVTASHNLTQDEGLEVGLPDGSAVAATLAGRDESTDLAVLKIAPGALAKGGAHAPEWTEIESVRVGHLALAVARPGRTVRSAMGIVGALGESWRTAMGGTIEHYLEADIGRRPGFSGGLLIDAAGHAIGMNTALGRHGPAITLPAVTLRRIVPELLSQGRVPRGYLGVGAYPVRVAQEGTSEGRPALMIVSLEPKGPASAAGVLQGDVLLSINNEAVASLGKLKGLLDSQRPGGKVKLGLLRAGQAHDAELVLGSA
jgi:serine protease DegQ